jgi:hypothetical protein
VLICISYGMIATGFDVDGTRSSRGRVSVDIALIVCGTRARPFGERHGPARKVLEWVNSQKSCGERRNETGRWAQGGSALVSVRGNEADDIREEG